MELGENLIRSLYREDSDFALINNYNINRDLFDDYARRMFDFIVKHKKEYLKLPEKKTVFDECSLPEYSDFMDDSPEPLKFYIDKIIRRHELRLFEKFISESASQYEKLLTSDSPIQESIDAVQSKIRDIKMDSFSKNEDIINITKDIKPRVERYLQLAERKKAIKGFPTPWNTLDRFTNGINKSEFWLGVARPGTGKTFLSILFFEKLREYFSSEDNEQYGPPMFISLEMDISRISVRSDAQKFRLPLYDFDRGKLQPHDLQRYVSDIADTSGCDAYIVGKKAANSIENVMDLVLDYKPSCLFIDSIWKFNERSTKDKNNLHIISNKMSELASSTGVPTFGTMQLNRPPSSKDEDPNFIEHYDINRIYGTDAFAMDCQVIFSLFQNRIMKKNNVMMVSILKARDGETCNFLVNWDPDSSYYTEIGLCDDKCNLIEKESYYESY